jgi:DNA-binding transcriptional ArsR family regulator
MGTPHRCFKAAIYGQLARIGKAVSAPKRIELLEILCQAHCTVESIAEQAAISVANARQHLQVLRAARLVDGLLDKGFRRITVLDIAGAALDRAKQRLGPRAATVTWVVGDITTWTPSGTYQVWHDRATFHFLVRPEAGRRIGGH